MSLGHIKASGTGLSIAEHGIVIAPQPTALPAGTIRRNDSAKAAEELAKTTNAIAGSLPNSSDALLLDRFC